MYVKMTSDKKTEIRKYDEYVHKAPVKSFVDGSDIIYVYDHFHCPKCNAEYKIPFTEAGCNYFDCKCGLHMYFTSDLRGDIDNIYMECTMHEKQSELECAEKKVCKNCGNNNLVTYEDGEKRCVVCMDKHKTIVVGRKMALKTNKDEWDKFNEALIDGKAKLESGMDISDILADRAIDEEDFNIIVHNTGLEAGGGFLKTKDYHVPSVSCVKIDGVILDNDDDFNYKQLVGFGSSDNENVSESAGREERNHCSLSVSAFENKHFSCHEHNIHYGMVDIKILQKCKYFIPSKDGSDCCFHGERIECTSIDARRSHLPKLFNDISIILKQCAVDK